MVERCVDTIEGVVDWDHIACAKAPRSRSACVHQGRCVGEESATGHEGLVRFPVVGHNGFSHPGVHVVFGFSSVEVPCGKDALT